MTPIIVGTSVAMFAGLTLFVPSVFGDDLLACAPGSENEKALVLCAIKYGGCSTAGDMVDDSGVKRFLLGAGCNALASQITGQNYDVNSFLGGALAATAGSASDAMLNDNDKDNDWFAYVLKVGVAVYKINSFVDCVNVAKTQCAERWRTSNYDPRQLESSLQAEITRATHAHFDTGRRCNTEAEMAYYDDSVYYENRTRSLAEIRATKDAQCRKFAPGGYYSIRRDLIAVDTFPDEPNLRLVDYDVDYLVYSIKKSHWLSGTTHVRLGFRSDTRPPRILGEIHNKRADTEILSCVIGIEGDKEGPFVVGGEQYGGGYRLTAVIDGLPAARVQMKPKDIIWRIDDTEVYEMKDLRASINSTPCQSHTVYFIRDGSSWKTTVPPY